MAALSPSLPLFRPIIDDRRFEVYLRVEIHVVAHVCQSHAPALEPVDRQRMPLKIEGDVNEKRARILPLFHGQAGHR